jgi:polar amino acid transport system substrate-binding protein
MKKSLIRYLVKISQLLLIVCALPFTNLAHTEPPKKILTIATGEWCPLLCLSTPEKPGVMMEIAQKAFPASEYILQIDNIEWPKAIEETRAGKHTMIAGTFHSEVPDFIFPTEGQAAIRECFYTPRKSSWFFTGAASLDTLKKLGTGEGYSYEEPLMSWLAANPSKNFSASSTNPFLENLAKMEKGEINALQEAENIVQWYLINAEKTPDIRQAGCQGNPKETYFAFSPALPESRALAEKLNDTTIQMRASGELKKVFAKYNLYDWK